MAKGTIMFKNMANKFKVYLECKISDIKNIKEQIDLIMKKC